MQDTDDIDLLAGLTIENDIRTDRKPPVATTDFGAASSALGIGGYCLNGGLDQAHIQFGLGHAPML